MMPQEMNPDMQPVTLMLSERVIQKLTGLALIDGNEVIADQVRLSLTSYIEAIDENGDDIYPMDVVELPGQTHPTSIMFPRTQIDYLDELFMRTEVSPLDHIYRGLRLYIEARRQDPGLPEQIRKAKLRYKSSEEAAIQSEEEAIRRSESINPEEN